MKRPSISLAMIVKNEAHHLPNLFKSIEGCFDEIHITDTGSTDNTVEIAKNSGAIVHNFEWVNDFSIARNKSFEPVKTDYVMWMDGDDILSNKESFIQWRDNVMDLADYWIARYDYTLNNEGVPLCSFARERVLKTSKQMQWEYFVHEGIKPVSNFGPVRTNLASTWHITHKRTDEDIKNDRSRNLKLFQDRKDKLDARMQYYYGKELFEAGKPVEAANVLLTASTLPELEYHDRVLTLQYACFAYLQCNQYERVIELGHQGSVLAPNRAEFYILIGDAYLKLNKFLDAIPFYNAAKACEGQLPKMGTTAIFHTEDMYKTYPRNQLARIYATCSRIDEARSEAKECLDRYNNPEAKILLEELDKMKNIFFGFKNAKSCDDIVISCPPGGPYEWDAKIYKERSMGGSETAAIEMAYWLHKLSQRKVKIFNGRQNTLTVDGVEYLPAHDVNKYMMENKPFLHIAWRHNVKITNAPTFLWCHDLFTPGAENTDNYSRLMCLTPFHKRYLMANHGIPEDKLYLTRNGIVPERFKEPLPHKNPNKIVFPNSPDRGLDRSIKIVERVREQFPDLELHVFYGIEHLPKYGHQKLHDNLKEMISKRPWIKYHGATEQTKLMQHFREAAVWLYPSDWIETSCISALELLGTGVYPIVRRTGGIVDTLSDAYSQGMCSIIDSDCISEIEHELYGEELIKTLKEKRWERVKIDPEKFSWKSVASQWLEDLPKLGYGTN